MCFDHVGKGAMFSEAKHSEGVFELGEGMSGDSGVALATRWLGFPTGWTYSEETREAVLNRMVC